MLPPINHSTFIHATPQQVFKVLTSAEGWDAWFTRETTLEPRNGGELILRWKLAVREPYCKW